MCGFPDTTFVTVPASAVETGAPTLSVPAVSRATSCAWCFAPVDVLITQSKHVETRQPPARGALGYVLL